jgi:hypothetical protein
LLGVLSLRCLRCRAALSENEIWLRGLFGERFLRAAELDSYGRLRFGGIPYVVLFDRQGTAKAIVAWVWEDEKAFEQWLSRNLRDAVTPATAIGVRTDSAAGDGHRLRSLESWARGLEVSSVVATVAVAGVSAFAPQYFDRARLALLGLPLLGVVFILRSDGLVKCFRTAGRTYPDVQTTLSLIPGFLCLFAFQSDKVLDWSALLVPAANIGGVFWLALFRQARTEGRWGILGIGLVAALYGTGAAVEVNQAFDKSAPRSFETTVLAKNTTRSSRGGATYYLQLGPWGDSQGATWRKTTFAIYQQAQPNEPVTVSVCDGALKVRWI